MLIVGGHDDAVLALNEQAKARMPGEVTLKIVPRATHLFEEPGALDAWAEALQGWGEALAMLRAQLDFSVDIRPRR
jgi:putative phosphoribosyl transferase